MEDDLDDFVSMSQNMHMGASEPLSPASNADPTRTRGKVLNDSVHGTFRLGPLAVKIMDSPQFQRLRDLKQLGLTYCVYPSASHNRFEHSLGVAHLAWKTAHHYRNGQKDLNLSFHDIELVEIAGLCHDLGHGPFSHVFDSCFLRQEGIHNWSHEEMSVKIFDTIVEDKNMLGTDLSVEDCKRIKAMILASHKDASPEVTGRQYLHEIVANGRNGLDVDKLDYLQRDGDQCGVKTGVHLPRLMTYSKVIDGQICYKRTAYEDVLDVFRERAKMHRRVYGHRKARGIDLLVVDVLRAANPVLKITDKIWDPRLFISLDDTILKRVEFYELDSLNEDDRKCMEEAQSILKRLRNRNLYRYCGDWQIPSQMVETGWTEPLPEEVFAFLPPHSGVSREDFVLLTLSIDHTAGTRNPLEHVRFFHHWEDETSHNLDPRHMSGFHYESYKECSVRVYCKKNDDAAVAAIYEATDSFLKHTYGFQIQCSTPIQKSSTNPNNRIPREISNPARKRTLFPVPEDSPPSKAIRAS